MDVLKRLLLSIGFFFFGVLVIGYLMVEQGSAYPQNPAWQLIGPIFLLFWWTVKIVFFAVVVIAVCALLYGLYLAADQFFDFWGEQARERERKERIETGKREQEEMQRQAAIEANFERKRLAEMEAEARRRAEEYRRLHPEKKEPEKIEPPKPKEISPDQAKRYAIFKIIGR